MIWRLLAIFGAGSFFVSGFSVLTDSTCRSVDFGGGRVIQMTCRADDFGAFSNTAAGWLSILGGLVLLGLIFPKPLKKMFNGIWNPKPVYSSSTFYDPANAAPEVNESKAENVATDSAETRNEVEDGQKKCPKCAELIKVEAIKCRHCGSSLLPTLDEKVKKIWSQGNYRWGISLSLVAVIALGALAIHNGNIAKEKQLLNESGQVCVYLSDGNLELGCADYPKTEFSFCSSAVSIEMEYANSNYESIFAFEDSQPIRVNGTRGYGCGENVPYSYDISTTTNRLLGEYELQQWRYDVPSGEKGDFEGGSDFLMKISLK